MKSSKNKEKDNLMDWEIYDDKTKKKNQKIIAIKSMKKIK